MTNLVNELQNKFEKKLFKYDYRYMLTGKTDYLLLEASDKISTNYKLLSLLLSGKSKVFDHVRKLRTKVLFEGPAKNSNKETKILGENSELKQRDVLPLQESLKVLTVRSSEISIANKYLKALKVSRHIKAKILKIFSNFNNGIQDPILFPFFLDFKIFVDALIATIKEEHKAWKNVTKMKPEHFMSFMQFANYSENQKQQNDPQSVDLLEHKFIKQINIFEEAYSLRMLNCYQFEDITDFDLDFNSSVQQLLSAYSSIIIETGNIFYDADKKYQFGPVIQLNLKDTQTNYSSINYQIHHLISPEFVFSTLIKEILNNEGYDNREIKMLFKSYKLTCENLKQSDPALFTLVKDEAFDFSYFVNDITRYLITYDTNFTLFYYWFWIYNMQNPTLFDKRGLMNESHFIKELTRIVLIARFFNEDLSQITCPTEELYTYWERHFKQVIIKTEKYLSFLETSQISGISNETYLTKLGEYLFGRFNLFLTHLFPSISYPFEEIAANTWNSYSKIFMAINRYNTSPDGIKIGSYQLLQSSLKEYKETGDAGNNLSVLSKLYINMRCYLEKIFTENNGKINFLRRNWETGMPLGCFIEANTNRSFYYADQTGGLFFDQIEKSKSYMHYSSHTLYNLLHYSQILKKDFIAYKIKRKHESK